MFKLRKTRMAPSRRDEELKQDFNELINNEMDFQIRVFFIFSKSYFQPVNDLLDASDINADAYETIRRTDG